MTLTSELVDAVDDEEDRGSDSTPETSDGVSAVVGVMAVSANALLRCGLRHVLRMRDDMKLVGEAATPRSGARLLAEIRPDVLLLDMTRDAAQPVELNLVNELMRRHPTTRVLAMLSSKGEGELSQLLALGVGGVVSRDCDPSGVVAGILALSAGRGFFHLERHVDARASRRPAAPVDQNSLTPREYEVLQLLALGLPNKQIGERLYISETTAKFHVSGLMRKFGVNRRTEIVYKATQQGLV